MMEEKVYGRQKGDIAGDKHLKNSDDMTLSYVRRGRGEGEGRGWNHV